MTWANVQGTAVWDCKEVPFVMRNLVGRRLQMYDLM